MNLSDAIDIARKTYSGVRVADQATAEALEVLLAADAPNAETWAGRLLNAVKHSPDAYPLTLAVPAGRRTSDAAAPEGAPAAGSPGASAPATAAGSSTGPASTEARPPNKLVLIGGLTIAAFLIIGFINAKWVYPAIGTRDDLGCDGAECTDFAITNYVVTGANGALEAFNPVMFWAAFGPGLIAGALLIAAGVIVDELQKRK